MENITVPTPLKPPITFILDGFYVPPGYSHFLFSLVLLNYLVTVLGNGVVMWVIVIDKRLHRPMFIMVCHLAVCDLLGATTVLPRLMVHFLTGQRKIAYAVAIAQAFCLHTYGSAVQTILGAMAYDRYIAVCQPLRYTTIMTSVRLHICCGVAWFIAVLCTAGLFGLHLNVPLCGNFIHHVYCTNRGILVLACHPTPTNDLYGLSMTWSVSSSIFLLILFSYIKILHASVKQGKSDKTVRSKAFQTCSTHLVLYVVYEVVGIVLVMSHRTSKISKNARYFSSLMFVIIPPAINPVIYGLMSKELRSSIIKLLGLKICCKKLK